MSNSAEFCLTCGKNLALVGRMHRCIERIPQPIADCDVVAAPTKKAGRPRKTPEGFDKASYQRDYMRKRRAAAKETT